MRNRGREGGQRDGVGVFDTVALEVMSPVIAS